MKKGKLVFWSLIAVLVFVLGITFGGCGDIGAPDRATTTTTSTTTTTDRGTTTTTTTTETTATTTTTTSGTTTSTMLILGIPDESFNAPTGYVVWDATNGNAWGMSIALDSAGKILVAGYSTNASGNTDMTIWRYNSDGTPDTGFSDGIHNGYVVSDVAGKNDVGLSIALDSAGKILVAGYSTNASDNADMTIWRYNANGTPDNSFDGDGRVIHNGAAGGNGDDWGFSITTDSAGKILVAGYSTNAGGNADMVIWRYNSNGTLDSSFDGDGMVVYNGAAGADDWGTSITIDSSGKVLVSGYSVSTNTDMAIWRYNSNGTPDNSFNGDGMVVQNGAAGGNGFDWGTSITLDSLGRIVVSGVSTNASSNADMVIWRYNSDGTTDEAFGVKGIAVNGNAAGGNGNDAGISITLDSVGRILVAGFSKSNLNEDMVIWRYK